MATAEGLCGVVMDPPPNWLLKDGGLRLTNRLECHTAITTPSTALPSGVSFFHPRRGPRWEEPFRNARFRRFV